jgi:nicotinamidase-related amidase
MNHNSNLNLLNHDDTLLLLIDLQEKFFPYLKHKERVLQSSKLLINVAKELSIPTIVTEHNPERIGPTIDVLKNSLEVYKPYSKNIFSCMSDPAIKAAIGEYKEVKNILILGCETHICVLQTAIEANNLGYNVHVASNGVSSRIEFDWNYGLKRLERAGIVVSTSEMMAYELLRRSDTPQFKNLLPFFKEWTSRVEQ